MRRFTNVPAALVALALVATACFGPDANQTEEGEGLPFITAEFPDVTEPGATETLSLVVENPGPGDLSSVFVTFSRVGAAEGKSLPTPIVDVVPKGESSPILAIRPEPVKQAQDIRFRFAGLPEGETMELEFDLRMPTQAGVAANSVQVYDGGDPDRIRGVLLSTRVQ
jgi:hypothetical protein